MPLTLNPRQLDAVNHVHGPMVVIAGAGTGKTTVLTHRIAALIRNGHARPDEILAVTFTDNAAQELQHRVAKDLRDSARAMRKKASPEAERLTAALRSLNSLRADTFHGYCFNLLRRCGKAFQALNQEDLWIYLRQHMQELGLEYYTRAVRPAEFLDALLEFFDQCHDELRTVADYERYVAKLCRDEYPLPRVTLTKKGQDPPGREEVLARCREIARVYRKVEDMLRAENFGTFGHMILHATQVLRDEPGLLKHERARARFLLVDEFQDCNIAQIELAQLLAGRERNLFVVGDPDQAIYRFRGASSRAFEEFVRRFPDAKGVMLDENQRSRTAILRCAFAVVEQNPAVQAPLGCSGDVFQRKPLVSARDQKETAARKTSPLAPVEIVRATADLEEAGDVAENLKRLQDERRAVTGQGAFGFVAKNGPAPFAVLYRSHSNRAELVRELAKRGVAFCVRGIDVLQTREGRDLMACMRALHSAFDSGALFRVAALPCFRVPAAVLREAWATRRRQEAPFANVLASVTGGEEVLRELHSARVEAAASDMKALAALDIVLKRLRFDASAVPVSTFRKFVEAWTTKPITRTGQLSEFVQYMECFAEARGSLEMPSAGENDPDAAQLMSIHAAKGLEFERVWILRANQGAFPTGYREKLFEFPRELRGEGSLMESEGPEAHKEEERRLFYVAMTRARDVLAVCGKLRGTKRPVLTGFARELQDAVKARDFRRERSATFTVDIKAAAAPAPIGVGAWLIMPPSQRLLSASLSATAIETYEECPLRFKIGRDWNPPGEVAAGLQFGSVVHGVLKTYYDAILTGRPRSDDQVLQIFRDSLAAVRFDDAHQQGLLERLGIKQLQQFLESCRRRPQPQVLQTEATFEINVQGVRVRGRIDRMDQTDGDPKRVAITDYKTGAPKDDKYARESLQLTIYALAAREKWKLRAERLVLHNLEDDSEIVTTRDADDMEEAKGRIVAVAEHIAAGHFEPSVGYQCRSCAYRSLCPATEERVY